MSWILVLGAWQQLSAATPNLKRLKGHVPPPVPTLQSQGDLPFGQSLSLALGLPLRNEAELESLLQDLQDPNHPSFRHYLTPEAFLQRFGPSEEDYLAVKAFAEKHGLRVKATHPNRLLLDVEGTAADVQSAFHVSLHTYQHPTEDRLFYSPDGEPEVEASIPLLDVSGLNDYVLPHSFLHSIEPIQPNAIAHAGSGAGGTFFGKDFRAAYMPGVTLTGVGQSVGLLEFDGYYARDITAYETETGLPNVPLQNVLLDGYNGVPTTGRNSGNGEVSLDIEMVIAMAPGISKLVVFEAGPLGAPNDILNSMATHPEIKQFSSSWGWGGGPRTTTDNIFKQMAAQGQSFFSASGDSDAFVTGQVDNASLGDTPSSNPYITIVGGTTLSTASAGGAWSLEKVWNTGNDSGSSGGISSHYSLPTWQNGLDMSANLGSTKFRNIPDVAMAADNIFVRYGNGGSGTFAGTSCAAPLWAGVAALMNEQASASGRPSVGFVNPALYALGKSSQYATAFHDITVGNNTSTTSPNAFPAVAGYDLCTGWGTPRGQDLIDAIAGAPDALRIFGRGNLVTQGPAGGPWSPDSLQITMTNLEKTTLSWSILSTSSWLHASTTQGTIDPQNSTSIQFTISDVPGTLEEGVRTTTWVVSNELTHVAQPLTFSFNIGQSLVQNGGFETGDFDGWTLIGNTTGTDTGGPIIYNGVQTTVDNSAVVHSGSAGAFLGDTSLATLSQKLVTTPGQYYLISFYLNNTVAGSGQEFFVYWINASDSPTALYSTTQAPQLKSWTNMQFLVQANAAKSTLRFAALNQSNGFGLDDVVVKPVPSPVLNAIEFSNSVATLHWRASPKLHYLLQYRTSLTEGGWVNASSPITATKSTVSTTHTPSGTAPTQIFYRLSMSP